MASRWWCLLACAAWSGCFGGPISDFPTSNTDRNSGGNAGGAEGDPGEAPVAPPGQDGVVGEGPMDAGAPDGEPPHPAPIRPPSGYVGPDGGCSLAAPEAGVACTGNYCGLLLDDVLMPFEGPGACLADMPALALVCRGELRSTLDECWHRWLDDGSVRYASHVDCVYEELAPTGASPACMDCYLTEHHCAMSYCLSHCDDARGDSLACEDCRREHCGGAFTRCSGLFAP